MANYLLNASLVWLLSLGLFELLFRTETVHAWNRAYLLITLGLGFVLPLFQWNDMTAPLKEAPPVTEILSQVTTIKTGLLPTATTATANTAPQEQGTDWIFLLYSLGLAVSFVLLLVGGVRMARLYRNGRRVNIQGFTLVETGRPHGPFSFFRAIFISATADYSKEELEFVLAHEQKHGRLLHSFDMLLVQLICCLLWAHPLIYWYRQRLRLVHEYQADSDAKPRAAGYGRFLISQSLLQNPSSLSHSFQQSPLKSRINMLIRPQSAGLRLARYFLVLPLLVVLMLCCTRFEGASQRRQEGNMVYFNGNTIEMAPAPLSKEDEEWLRKYPNMKREEFPVDTVPYKLNGALIYNSESWSQAPRFKVQGTPMDAIFQSVSGAVGGLPNGKYMLIIHDVVIDEKGRVAYYLALPLRKAFGAIVTDPKTGEKMMSLKVVMASDTAAVRKSELTRPKLDADILGKVAGAITTKLEQDISFTPAMVNGKPVPADVTGLINFDDLGYDLEVKDGKVSLVKSASGEWREISEQRRNNK